MTLTRFNGLVFLDEMLLSKCLQGPFLLLYPCIVSAFSDITILCKLREMQCRKQPDKSYVQADLWVLLS